MDGLHISYVVHCTPDDEKAGGVVLVAQMEDTREPVVGNGETFFTVSDAQDYCINAGYLEVYDHEAADKRSKRK